ncbi:MAG: hypothetical protein MZV63_21490 [Marinilabiliales bacterium]|nr:hypothetical protein [Marinilabiliales bacterium]
MNNAYAIKKRRYYGGSFTGLTGPIGTAPSYWRTQLILGCHQHHDVARDGIGRWLYRDDAPYILMTHAELKFCLSEAALEAEPQG